MHAKFKKIKILTFLTLTKEVNMFSNKIQQMHVCFIRRRLVAIFTEVKVVKHTYFTVPELDQSKAKVFYLMSDVVVLKTYCGKKTVCHHSFSYEEFLPLWASNFVSQKRWTVLIKRDDIFQEKFLGAINVIETLYLVPYKQECIPVGCVPSAAVAVSGEGVCQERDVCLVGWSVCLGGVYTPLWTDRRLWKHYLLRTVMTHNKYKNRWMVSNQNVIDWMNYRSDVLC